MLKATGVRPRLGPSSRYPGPVSAGRDRVDQATRDLRCAVDDAGSINSSIRRRV